MAFPGGSRCILLVKNHIMRERKRERERERKREREIEREIERYRERDRERDRRPNFVLYVVCSALIVGGWVVLAWSRTSYLGPAKIVHMCGGPIDTVECI